MNIPSFLTSSADSQKLALTVKGILVGIIPLLLIVAQSQGWNLGQNDLNNFAEAVSTLIIAYGGVFSAGMVLAGVIRKIFVAVGLIKPNV